MSRLPDARSLPLAHGFGLHYNLPVPLYLYLLAAGAVVALTFAALGAFLRGTGAEPRYPRLVLSGARGVPGVRALVGGPVPRLVGGTVGVLALLTIVVTGLLGSTQATLNPAEYLLWIYFWAAAVVVSGLVGNLYALLNPFSALYDTAARVRRRRVGTGPPAASGSPAGTGPPVGSGRLVYPARLGLWPAVAGYLAFAWFELASGLSATPRAVGAAALLYTAYTLVMMGLYGRDAWLAHGEVFSVLFRLIGAFAPVEIRAMDPRACERCRAHCAAGTAECVDCPACFRVAARREVALRSWAVGLLRLTGTGWDTVTFVVLALSSLAFDGLSATPAWASLQDRLGPGLEPLGGFGRMLLETAGLLGVTVLFLAVFAAVARLVERLGRLQRAGLEITTLFAFTLVPIALVYNAAHNYSYIVISSQGLVPLLADPLHRGAHLLPVAGYQVSFALANAQLVWYLQVVLIVVGHVLAVYVAHVRALLLAPRSRDAVRSQLPMLALMVVYTMSSLWILAQPLTGRPDAATATARRRPRRAGGARGRARRLRQRRAPPQPPRDELRPSGRHRHRGDEDEPGDAPGRRGRGRLRRHHPSRPPAGRRPGQRLGDADLEVAAAALHDAAPLPAHRPAPGDREAGGRARARQAAGQVLLTGPRPAGHRPRAGPLTGRGPPVCRPAPSARPGGARPAGAARARAAAAPPPRRAAGAPGPRRPGRGPTGRTATW